MIVQHRKPPEHVEMSTNVDEMFGKAKNNGLLIAVWHTYVPVLTPYKKVEQLKYILLVGSTLSVDAELFTSENTSSKICNQQKIFHKRL